MVDRARTLNTALNLMERALELLDDAGESVPATYLQMAVAVMSSAPVPQTIEEADAILATPKMRVLAERLIRSAGPDEADAYSVPAPAPEAIARAAELVRLYGDKALGRVRMQLYEALGRQEPAEVDRLAQVCSVLMQKG